MLFLFYSNTWWGHHTWKYIRYITRCAVYASGVHVQLLHPLYLLLLLLLLLLLDPCQEEIRDLLSKDHKKRLELKERPDTGVYVKDLSSFVAKNVKEIEHVMTVGKQNRSVGWAGLSPSSVIVHTVLGSSFKWLVYKNTFLDTHTLSLASLSPTLFSLTVPQHALITPSSTFSFSIHHLITHACTFIGPPYLQAY